MTAKLAEKSVMHKSSGGGGRTWDHERKEGEGKNKKKTKRLMNESCSYTLVAQSCMPLETVSFLAPYGG